MLDGRACATPSTRTVQEGRTMVGKTVGYREDRDMVSSGKQDRRTDVFGSRRGLDWRADFGAIVRHTNLGVMGDQT
jgi:hypothetical protein